jgi:hypothetical protein
MALQARRWLRATVRMVEAARRRLPGKDRRLERGERQVGIDPPTYTNGPNS